MGAPAAAGAPFAYAVLPLEGSASSSRSKAAVTDPSVCGASGMIGEGVASSDRAGCRPPNRTIPAPALGVDGPPVRVCAERSRPETPEGRG